MPTPTTPVPGPAPSAPPADVASAISEADSAFQDGQAACGRGDFVAYGQAQERLADALDRLTELQRGATTAPAPAG